MSLVALPAHEVWVEVIDFSTYFVFYSPRSCPHVAPKLFGHSATIPQCRAECNAGAFGHHGESNILLCYL